MTSLEKYLGFPILKRRAKGSDFMFIIGKKCKLNLLLGKINC